MPPLGWIMYGTVGLWLAPGSLFRPVATTLLVGWAIGEFIFAQFGDYVPVYAYVPIDLGVVATVLFKRSHWSDWLIIAPLPVVWFLYTQPVTHNQWFALYVIAFAQYLVAGPWPNIYRAIGGFSHGPLREGSTRRDWKHVRRFGLLEK